MIVMKLTKGSRYIAISFILWIIVEYITVWHSSFGEWMRYMPWVLFQYLFIILLFWFFLFVRRRNEKGVFIVMVLVMYIFEFLWQNILLFNIRWFIPVSIFLIQVWGFLAFIPFWIVDKSIKKHKELMVFYCLWPVVGFVLALFV